MPRFGRGSSVAAAGRSGVLGGEALASTAAAAPSFLGGYLVYQASTLRSTYLMQGLAGLVIDFIQLLHGADVPVQEVKPGINHGILSLLEERHSMSRSCPRRSQQSTNLEGVRWRDSCAFAVSLEYRPTCPPAFP
jgi:hypothetical protein